MQETPNKLDSFMVGNVGRWLLAQRTAIQVVEDVRLDDGRRNSRAYRERVDWHRNAGAACLLACLLAPIRGSVAEVTELSARDDVHSHAERGGGYGSVEAAPRVYNRTNKRQDKQDRAQYVEEGLPNIPRVITSPETQIFIGAGHCP